MLKRFQIFLGPRRFRAFLVLLASTGLASLALNAIANWSDAVTALQTLLLLVFLAGATYLIMSRLPSEERKRWLAVILPSVLAIVIGSLIAPQLAGMFVGGGHRLDRSRDIHFQKYRRASQLQDCRQGNAQRRLRIRYRGDYHADQARAQAR